MDREIPAKERVRKKLKVVLLVALLLSVLIIGQIMISRSLKSVTVHRSDILIAKVERGRMEGSFSAEAIVTPISTYSVEAMTGGRIEAIYYNAGDYVKKGDSILKLSNDDLKLNLLAQEASVTDQVNNLSNARILSNQSRLSNKLKIAEAHNSLKREQRNFTQKSELHQSGYIAQEEFLIAEEEYQIAETRYTYLQEEARTDSLYRQQQLLQLEGAVNQLQLSLQQIRNRINELDVKAPMSGQITEIDLRLGQIISTGSFIAVIEDDTRYYLQAKVDQYYLGRLSVNAMARVRVQGEETVLNVMKIHPRLANDKVLVDIQGDIPKALKSGQSVSVDIITDSLEDVLFLPQGQYLADGSGTWVYVLSPDGKKAIKRTVSMGFRNIREAEVIDGLSAGEEVIISSYKAFQDKEIIKIKD